MATRNGIRGCELCLPGRMLLGLVPRTGSGAGEIKAGSIALSWEFVLGSLEIFALKGGLKEKWFLLLKRLGL